MLPSSQPTSRPSLSPTEVIYHDLAPDILDTAVVYSVFPSPVVRLDLVLSEAATVYCGVFAHTKPSRYTAAPVEKSRLEVALGKT